MTPTASPSGQRNTSQIRSYRRAESVVFLKTKEAFGGLSNMASGYPLEVNGVRILTSEALYQACRFPDLPDVQRKIIEQVSPMSAKMVGKPYREKTRPDWDWVRMNIMRWCLRVKLAQNWKKFGDLLLETGSRPIVEESRKDEFWGAKPVDENILVGMNVLGRLLMELREEFKKDDCEKLKRVEPLKIPRFRLFGEAIRVVDESTSKDSQIAKQATTVQSKAQGIEQRELTFKPTANGASAVTQEQSKKQEASSLASLRPYPAYKDSGSPWLMEVPSHWGVRNLRTLIRTRNERNRPDLPLLSVAREKGVFVRSLTDSDENHNVIPEDLSNYKVARSGNLVINKMKAWQGSMGVAPCDGIVSPAYFVFDFAVGNRGFGQALLRSRPYIAHFGQASDGVRIGQWDLTIAGMRQIPVLLPPFEEQAAIVHFLGHVNRQLDRTIRTKRKMIALLLEQKQAIIHRAVIRGLDPTVPLRPSSITWLGDIPTHWEETALRRYWRVTDCKHLTVPFVADGIPLASVVEVQSFTLNLDRCKKTKPSWYRMLIEGDRKPRRGDLIYCRNASVGACALVETDIDFAMGQDVCLIRSKLQNQRFLNYQLHSPFMDHQLELLLVGSTFKRINVADIKALTVIVPPRKEQDAICEHLDRDLVVFDTAIARLEREIELLQEYRTRLTADVVTGKLDVRAAAENLPDLAAETTAELAEADSLGEVEPEEAEA